jgi:DNA-binding MarR family transcriptional regulator
MHALFFSIKRTHHRILSYGRFLFKNIGLTPARFDMLHALEGTDRDIVITQRKLRDILGVTAATVSRMARSLEELGLITRTTSTADARNLVVRLTEEGVAMVARAVRIAVGSGAVDLLVDCAFSFKWYAESRFEELFAIDEALWHARHQLHDYATLHYYFHPDD